jgi:hypothetical protein
MGRILWEKGRDWLVETICGNILWKQIMEAMYECVAKPVAYT